MIFSIGLFFVKKTPKFVLFLLTIINIIMIFFVMNASTHDSDAYADLYLVELQFNETSGITNALSTQYNSKHDGNNIDDFIMRIGFMGVCVDFGNEMNCGYISNMDYTYQSEVPSFSVTTSNESSNTNTTTSKTTSTSSLELFDIAYKIQQKTISYRIFIVEIIFLLILLITQFYNMIGFLPFQKYILYLAALVLSCFWIILTISITWVLVVCHDLISLGNVMTMNVLEFSKGKRVQGILWASFAITVVQLIYYTWLFIKDSNCELINICKFNKSNVSKNNNADIEKEAGSVSDSVMSSITTLRGTL